MGREELAKKAVFGKVIADLGSDADTDLILLSGRSGCAGRAFARLPVSLLPAGLAAGSCAAGDIPLLLHPNSLPDRKLP